MVLVKCRSGAAFSASQWENDQVKRTVFAAALQSAPSAVVLQSADFAGALRKDPA